MPTLLIEHTIYSGVRPPKPWSPTVLLTGGNFRGLTLDGRDDATTALRRPPRGALAAQRDIPIARQQDVRLDTIENDDGTVVLQLWSLP